MTQKDENGQESAGDNKIEMNLLPRQFTDGASNSEGVYEDYFIDDDVNEEPKLDSVSDLSEGVKNEKELSSERSTSTVMVENEIYESLDSK